MKAAGRARSLPLDKRVFCAWLISFAVVCPLLSLMDLRYGRQLSNWWYLLFSAGLFLLWLLVFRARRAATAGVAAALLVCAALYFAALPPYTYRQAISLLEQQYPNQVFSPAPAGSSITTLTSSPGSSAGSRPLPRPTPVRHSERADGSWEIEF